MIRALLAVAFGLILSGCALAQSTLLQGGPWVAGRASMYTSSGSSQPVVQDSGPAGGGAVGLGMSEGLYVARGTGVPPFVGQGTGPLGTNWCDYDAPITNATGYHYLCLSANVGSAGLIAYGSGGAASQQPLRMNVNGTNYDFPFVIGGIVGPSTTVIGDIATWANTTGTLLADTAQIALTHLASIADQTCLGNVSGVSAAPSALTKAQCTTLINAFTSLLPGIVPASGGGTANYLRADATWAPVVANPTGMIGLATVNGSSNIAIRSDGTPALSQAIAPLWSAKHRFSAVPPLQFTNFTGGFPVTDSTGNVTAVSGCLAIEAFGGNGDNSTDNLTAWNNAVAAASLATRSGCISFGPGIFKFSTEIAATWGANSGYPQDIFAIGVYGAGPHITTLKFHNTNGIHLTAGGNQNSFHVRDLSLTTDTVNVGAGLLIDGNPTGNPNSSDQIQSDISGVNCQGDGPPFIVTSYWNYCGHLTNQDNVNIVNDYVQGPTTGGAGKGFIVEGTTSPANPAVNFNFLQDNFDNLDIAIVYGDKVQGVFLTAVNITGGNKGVYVPAGETSLDELGVVSSQFGEPAIALDIESCVNSLHVANSLFIIGPSQTGIKTCSEEAAIVSNVFAGTGPSANIGVWCTTGASSIIIAGNTINELAKGYQLDSGCNNNNVQSNVYFGNTSHGSNAGTSNTIGGGSD